MGTTLDWNAYKDTAANMAAEGIVMLKNNSALPLKKNSEVAVFGRIQTNYYKSGTGSGGMVNIPYLIGIPEALSEFGIKINDRLAKVYAEWEQSNPFDLGVGWGKTPWSQVEMPLEDSLVAEIAKSVSTAIVLIGRTAGEEQDNHTGGGSYCLTDAEKDMLTKVRSHFEKMVVLLNVGNIIDMNFFDECDPDSILYLWQGGMVGGLGAAKVLTGEVSPCGKLPDTIAYRISDYPSDKFFGGIDTNCYSEDIYVGYRYFETFAQDAVKYPFGFGLSYTTFDITTTNVSETDDKITFDINVQNTGNYPGKEVVQVYFEAPQGALGKALRALCAFEKTAVLNPGDSQKLTITVVKNDLAAYDDCNATGQAYSYVLEAGKYNFYIGSDVRSAGFAYSFTTDCLKVTQKLNQYLAPVNTFDRMKPISANGSYEIAWEKVPTLTEDEDAHRASNLPEEIEYTGDKGYKLQDVYDKKTDMDTFIAQLNVNELNCLIRGEGMGSPRVTAGTASAFGGVSDSLTEKGIPCACCADGPSGLRLDCGTHAFSLPNGTLIAASFNKELATELFKFYGIEMISNNIDCVLGPGMNIHRHPLNGRNFEYFSEDPYLTGMMAAAELKGLREVGSHGTVKHFCANNQEHNRHIYDSVVSERALREIYLKGFELAVKSGYCDSVMTTYGKLNGLWTAGHYDLNTSVLRDEWGFEGIVMTDWWADINERTKPEASRTNFAAMVRAQNDLYMVCANGSDYEDNVAEAIEDGTLSVGELQRCAKNICNFILDTTAMRRLVGIDTAVTAVNLPENSVENDQPVIFYDLGNELDIDLSEVKAVRGSSYSFALNVENMGYYDLEITASSTQSELAQIPATVFVMGTAMGTFTWNGTNGKPVSFNTEITLFSKYTVVRMYFAQSGLDLISVKIRMKTPAVFSGHKEE